MVSGNHDFGTKVATTPRDKDLVRNSLGREITWFSIVSQCMILLIECVSRLWHDRYTCVSSNPLACLCFSMVSYSSLAGILGECSTIHSPLRLKKKKRSRDELVHTNFTLCARIRPQWLSDLRRLWRNVPILFACELVSGQVPTLCLDNGIVSPLLLRCHLHFWRNDRVFYLPLW